MIGVHLFFLESNEKRHWIGCILLEGFIPKKKYGCTCSLRRTKLANETGIGKERSRNERKRRDEQGRGKENAGEGGNDVENQENPRTVFPAHVIVESSPGLDGNHRHQIQFQNETTRERSESATRRLRTWWFCEMEVVYSFLRSGGPKKRVTTWEKKKAKRKEKVNEKSVAIEDVCVTDGYIVEVFDASRTGCVGRRADVIDGRRSVGRVIRWTRRNQVREATANKRKQQARHTRHAQFIGYLWRPNRTTRLQRRTKKNQLIFSRLLRLTRRNESSVDLSDLDRIRLFFPREPLKGSRPFVTIAGSSRMAGTGAGKLKIIEKNKKNYRKTSSRPRGLMKWNGHVTEE